MKYTLLACALLVFVACSKQEKSEEKVGTAMNSSYSEVIGSDGGYIIENAQLAGEGEAPDYMIEGACKLVRGTSSVLIVHSKDDSNGGTILALQVPAFAEGTTEEYTGEPGSSGFFVYGMVEGVKVAKETGLTSGSLRFTKQEEADVNLGLNRTLMKGMGEMEIVVSTVDGGGLQVPAEKKYAARFELPMITLDELIKINAPA